MKLQKLNKKIMEVIVAEIMVYAKDRVEIKGNFRDEFWEVEKVENTRELGGD